MHCEQYKSPVVLVKNIENTPVTRGWRIFMAERQGFEPWIALLLYTRSRRAPSTTRTPLRI